MGDALKTAADLMNLSLDAARAHSIHFEVDLLLVWSDVPGEGSVLVGRDGDVLWFAPSTDPGSAAARYYAGDRTELDEFAVFLGRPTRT